MNFTNIPKHTSLPFLNREEDQKLAKPLSICATKQNTKPDQFGTYSSSKSNQERNRNQLRKPKKIQFWSQKQIKVSNLVTDKGTPERNKSDSTRTNDSRLREASKESKKKTPEQIRGRQKKKKKKVPSTTKWKRNQMRARVKGKKSNKPPPWSGKCEVWLLPSCNRFRSTSTSQFLFFLFLGSGKTRRRRGRTAKHRK